MSEERQIQVGDILTFKHDTFGDIPCVVLAINSVETTNIYTMCSMKPIITRRYSDKGCHWSESEIRSWLNGEFLEGFSIKDAIMSIENSTGKRGMKNITEKTDDKIWLFSEHEVGSTFGRPDDVDEGNTYPYICNSEMLKHMTGEENPSFLLRSPSIYIQGDEVMCVKDGGINLVNMKDEMPILIGFCAV